MGLTQHYARGLGFRFIRREQPVDHLVADTQKLTKEGPGSVPALEKRGTDIHARHLVFSQSSFSSVVTRALSDLGGEERW